MATTGSPADASSSSSGSSSSRSCYAASTSRQQPPHHLAYPQLFGCPAAWDLGRRASSQQQQQSQQSAHAHLLSHPASNSRNPFDACSRIPLPHPFGEFAAAAHLGCESSFIRRRNERERERVRYVNEGYERLKDSLPFDNKDKRISKVEILKTAIRYIRHMEDLLAAADHQQLLAVQDRKRSSRQQQLSQELQQESPEKKLRHC